MSEEEEHEPKVVSVETLHPSVGELVKVIEVVLASAARGVSSGGSGILGREGREGERGQASQLGKEGERDWRGKGKDFTTYEGHSSRPSVVL